MRTNDCHSLEIGKPQPTISKGQQVEQTSDTHVNQDSNNNNVHLRTVSHIKHNCTREYAPVISGFFVNEARHQTFCAKVVA